MEKKRMYIICRGDLNPLYAAIQGGHALADHALQHPDEFADWGNSFIIYLKERDEEKLQRLKTKLEGKGLKCGKFIEPDIGHSLTAISCYAEPGTFKNLSTLRLK